MAAEGFPYPLSVGGADALVDGQCLPQVRDTFHEVTVAELAMADPFQGTGFF